MTTTIASILARQAALRATTAPQQAAPPKVIWTPIGYSDVFDEQHCTACGAIATVHLGRFVVQVDRESGARRLTRSAIMPDDIPLTRETWQTEAPVCSTCWERTTARAEGGRDPLPYHFDPTFRRDPAEREEELNLSGFIDADGKVVP